MHQLGYISRDSDYQIKRNTKSGNMGSDRSAEAPEQESGEVKNLFAPMKRRIIT
jgi:hypothetical protein